jgi:dipeptidase
MLKFKSLLLSALLLIGLNTMAQDENERLVGANCTSIMVGKNASTDGSVITSHTCDGRYRTWMRWEPAADHEKGEMHKVYKGTMHTEDPFDNRNVELAGEIPQVAHTYAYLNTAYPCLNEKQLAIGETTFSGPDTLVNKKGMFMIEELERVALMRCDNARDAIQLIGKLVKDYGYGDGGECITIADKNEVWQMEILGEGPDKVGGVWAAKRIPDDEVGVSANIARIGKLERKSKDFYCSDNCEAVAKKYGLWDGKGDFIFWKAFRASYGGGKNYSDREFFILSQLAPSLNLNRDMPELPFSVKPDENVDVRKVMELFRSTYEGTDMDMTRNVKMVSKKRQEDGSMVEDTIISPVANPWVGSAMMNTINYLAPGTINFQRTVAVAWSSYHHIIQCRSWMPDEIGAICWMACDNPGQSPRIPIFSGSTSLPEGFDKCGQLRYRDEAWIWHYRKANKLATVQWGRTKQTLLSTANRFEQKAFDEIPAIEERAKALLAEDKKKEATETLNQYTSDFAASTRQAWKEMENKFWYWFSFGF